MSTARRRTYAPARAISVSLAGAVDANVSATEPLVIPVSKQTTKGNSLLACIKLSVGGTVTSITDTQGNTWAADVTDNHGSQTICQIWRCTITKPLGSSDSVTINYATAQFPQSAILLELGGLLGSSTPLDQTAMNHGASGSNTCGPTSTTSQANEVAISVFGLGGTAGQNPVYGPPLGWTEVPSGLSDVYVDCAYLILTSKQTVSATWSDSAPTQNTSQVIATYRGA